MKVFDFGKLPTHVQQAVRTVSIFCCNEIQNTAGIYIASNDNLVVEEVDVPEEVTLDRFPESMTCHVQAPKKTQAA